MKYLIQKGFRGFGDRLRNLVMCVKIAIEQNRKIYVDWNDFYWNHTGENFYTYFEILDMGEIHREYDPIRILPDERVNRMNENIMSMTDDITTLVVNHVLGKKDDS
jgi:hypothetical protein